MPFARSSELQEITEQEKVLLVSALSEMKKRGIDVSRFFPDKEAEKLKAELYWHRDLNGHFLKKDGTHFNANPNQKLFLESDARFLALIAGRGSGKTSVGAQKALRKIVEGKPGMVLNPDFENFRLSTWQEFREWIPPEQLIKSHRYRLNPEWTPHIPFTLVFNNGATVYCKGLKDPNSARGSNVNWLWYDEGGRDETGMGWRIANAAVRIGDKPQSWVTATPRGKTHWLYKFFVEKEISAEILKMIQEAVGEDRKVIDIIFTSIEDNKANLSPDFYASMLANYPSGWLRDQELSGKFVDEGSSMGDRTWFEGHIVLEVPETLRQKVIYWDLAASEKKLTKRKGDDPDFTVGTVTSQSISGKYYIEDQFAAQIAWSDIKRLIVEKAHEYGVQVPVYIEQEPGSGGINQVAEISSLPELAGHVVRGHNPRQLGDKIMRAQSWFAKAEQGLIYLVSGDWNNAFLDQLSSFPISNHDDRIDSVSGCFHIISPVKRWATPQFIKL